MKCKVILERLNARQFFYLPLAQPDTTALLNETAADLVHQLLAKHPEMSGMIIRQLTNIEDAVVQSHQRFVEERNATDGILTGLQTELTSIQKAILAKRDEITTLEKELEDIARLADSTMIDAKIKQLAKQKEILGQIYTAIMRHPDCVHQTSTIPLPGAKNSEVNSHMVKPGDTLYQLTGTAASDYEEYRQICSENKKNSIAMKFQDFVTRMLHLVENIKLVLPDSNHALRLKNILVAHGIAVEGIELLDQGELPPAFIMSPELLSTLIPFTDRESAEVLRETLHLISLNKRRSVFTDKLARQFFQADLGIALRNFLAPLMQDIEQARFDLTRRMGIAQVLKLGEYYTKMQVKEEISHLALIASLAKELSATAVGISGTGTDAQLAGILVLKDEYAVYASLVERNARARYTERIAPILDRINAEIARVEKLRNTAIAQQQSVLSKQRTLDSLQASLTSLEETEEAVIKSIEEAEAAICSITADDTVLEVFGEAIRELEGRSPAPVTTAAGTTMNGTISQKVMTDTPARKKPAPDSHMTRRPKKVSPAPSQPVAETKDKNGSSADSLLPDSWLKVTAEETYTISIGGLTRRVRFTPGVLSDLRDPKDTKISHKLLTHLRRGNINKSPNGEEFPYSVTIAEVTKALFGRDVNGEPKHILFERFRGR